MGQRIKPQDQMDTQDLTAGQGPVSDPSGIAAAGGTPDQAKMAGTPAQTQANIEMQKRAQDQRLAEQEQASAAEQQRLAGETLAQQKRYERPAIPETQPQAVQIADTLNKLGPVRTRVQSLIQERLQAAQTAATTLEVNEAAVAAIEDPVKRQNAQAALNAYITSPTEDNLKKIYEAIGSEKTEDLQQFFTTPEGTIQESFQAAFEISPTLGSLDLAAIDVDMPALASALGIPEPQLKNMTLDQLNQQIAAIEASELNRVDQLQAQLQDPTTSPAMREAIIAELQQLGASGVIEAEADIEALQDQIDTANTIDILGREMSVEQLLSDEGLSSLVAQAVTDEKMLQALKDDPEYAALGNWIEQNKASLAVLAAEYEEQGEEFVDLQDKYKELKESLGADGLDLLKSIYGDEFFSSVTTKEFEDFKAKLEANPYFRFLTKEGNSKYLTMVKNDPELQKQMLESGFEETELEYTFEMKDRIDQDPFFATLIGGSAGIEFGKDGFVFDQDTMDKLRKMDSIERYDALPAEDITALKGLQKDWEDSGGEGLYIDLDLADSIAATGKSEALYADYTTIVKSNSDMDDAYSIERDDEGNIISADMDALRKAYFGGQKFDANDLKAYLRTIDEDTKKEVLAVFDLDGKDGISDAELNDIKVVDNLLDAMGLKASKEDILKAKGDWELGSVPKSAVPKDAFENAIDEAFDVDFIKDMDAHHKKEKDKYVNDFTSGLGDGEKHLALDSTNFAIIQEQSDANKDYSPLNVNDTDGFLPLKLEIKDGAVSIKDVNKFDSLISNYNTRIKNNMDQFMEYSAKVADLKRGKNDLPGWDKISRDRYDNRIGIAQAVADGAKRRIGEYTDKMKKLQEVFVSTKNRVDKHNEYQNNLKGYSFNVDDLISNFSKYAKIGNRNEEQQAAYDKYYTQLTDNLTAVYGDDKNKWPENIRWVLGD